VAEIDDEVLRALFDTAVHSMDFGSGFLDDEEVASLRAVAVILGVDPLEGTPGNFKCKYRGHHRANVFLDTPMFTDRGGVRRNAYRQRRDFPAGVKLSGLPGSTLAMSRARVLRMFCQDCGQRWDVLDPVPGLRP
jgi:hypothetical protein